MVNGTRNFDNQTDGEAIRRLCNKPGERQLGPPFFMTHVAQHLWQTTDTLKDFGSCLLT